MAGKVRLWLLPGMVFLCGGCATYSSTSDPVSGVWTQSAQLTPISQSHQDLTSLPEPKGLIAVSVYGFRDLTGQYKPTPDSSFSTAVTQGAGAMLTKALKDSKWFIPVEREGLQNLLTERKILRATEKQLNSSNDLPPLLPASVLLEGGIIAYESNVTTGGIGARYFGVGANELYRTDQVTISMRTVDIRTGRILNSVSTTKTILSRKLAGDVFQFVQFKRLFEGELGYTRNEPVQLCVLDAIEAGLVHLIAQGILDKNWALKDSEKINSEVLQLYIEEQQSQQQTNNPVSRLHKSTDKPEPSLPILAIKDEKKMGAGSKSGKGFTGKIGTLGYGAELSLGMSDSITARAGFNTYVYKYNSNSSALNYDVKLRLKTASAIVDWYPTEGGYHISGGFFYNRNIGSFWANPSGGNYTINSVTYAASSVGSLKGTMTFNKVAPYIGMGWGNPVARDKGWGLVTDMGILFQGKPSTRASSCGCCRSIVGTSPAAQKNLP